MMAGGTTTNYTLYRETLTIYYSQPKALDKGFFGRLFASFNSV